MAETTLNLHSGGHLVTYEELKAVPTPKPEGRWHPVAHSAVLDTVRDTLAGSGYEIKSQSLAIARDGKRFFGTLDLTTPLTEGVALAVGLGNSTDKSFPLGFAGGSRVFVCSNLSFTSDLLVTRKHTRHAVNRWNGEIGEAVKKLATFTAAEQGRLKRLMEMELTDDRALAFIIRAMEKHIIAPPVIPKILADWRTPAHDYGTGDRPTAWKLLNCFTTVLGRRAVSNPTEYASQTIRLNALLLPPAETEAATAA